MIETNNVLSNPSGPECQFLVGEGELVAATAAEETSPSRLRPLPTRSTDG